MELRFPYAGIDRSLSRSQQPANTTDEAANVLPLDATTGIVRGAKRPGLKRAGSAAIDAAHVQDVVQVTYANQSLITYTPAATGGGFTGSSEWTAASPNGTSITAETYDGEGNRYAVDAAGCVFKTSTDGKLVWQVAISKKHLLHYFRGIAVGPNGDVYLGVGRKNELGTASQVSELEKKGQASARIYRFQQVELTDTLQSAVLKWEYVTKRFIADMKIAGADLVTIEEDVEVGWAYATRYQSLIAGAPTVRWQERVPYPANCVAIAKDGTVYFGAEPAFGSAGTSVYSQSRRNAQASLSGCVGPVPHGFSVNELKKLGYRVWADFRADMVDGTLAGTAKLPDGTEVTEWLCSQGTGRRLSIPSGLFTFPGATGSIPAEGPRIVKRGPNGLPAVRFLGITGMPGTSGSQRFQGLISDPSDSTPEQSESQCRKVLPEYDKGAFICIVVMRPEFGATQRMAVLSQDNLSEANVEGVAAGSRIPLTLAVNQAITSGAWSTTPSGGQVALVDPVYVGGAGGLNPTSAPNGVTYDANFRSPVSVNGTQTKAGTLALPHGYCIASFIVDGKFTGSFQDETTFLGTMSQFAVNGSVSDKNRYGSHERHASANSFTSFFSSTTVGFSHPQVVGFSGVYPSAASGNFDPLRGDIVRILVLNRYDKSVTTGLHTNTDDTSTADPIILSHTLLPDSTTVLDGDGAPPAGDDLLTFSISDQIAGASTTTVDELELLMGMMQGEYGIECLPNSSDGAGPPFEYKTNPFAQDPCVNRDASGCPPIDTSIAFGGPRDPNWINYPHGMVWKLNGDDGSQTWVAADYSSAANNAGLGLGLAVVQDYGDDEANPSVRKLISYGPLSDWKNAYARVLTDNGETVSMGSPITLLDPGVDVVVFRDRYPKVGADQFGNAFIPGNFLSNYTGDAFTFAIVKKDGTVRLKYDADATFHAPCYSAQPDPISPVYPESVDKLARYVVLGLLKDWYNSVPAIGSTATACLRKVVTTNVSTPSGLPRVSEVIASCGASLEKYSESAGALSGPTAITAESGANLSASSMYHKLVVTQEKVVGLDGNKYIVYDPKATTPLKVLKAKKGRIPERALLAVSWLNSLVLGRPADSPTELFGSKTGDLYDWDTAPAIQKATSAWRLQNRAGAQADPITCLIDARDDLLILGGERSMSRVSGHPNLGGRPDNISNQMGILFDAWTRDTEGNIYVVTTTLEVYIITEGGGMKSISGARMREPLQAIDLSKYRLKLAWDARREMLLVFPVPWASGDLTVLRTGYVWYRPTDGWFTMDWATAELQPTTAYAARGDTAAVRELLLGCKDGWLRFFDASIAYDEAADASKKRIDARVRLTPLVLDGRNEVDIHAIKVVLATTDDATEKAQGGCDFELYVSNSPDVVVEPVESFKVLPGFNERRPVVARGCIVTARIVNAEVDERFAFERVIVETSLGGDHAP